jgi:hypothetical protein
MKRFKEFLIEGEKFIYGINHLNAGAGDEIIDLAKKMGYTVEPGARHIKIFNPKTNELVTLVSRGGSPAPGRMRQALLDIEKNQKIMGGFAGRNITVKEIKKEMAANPKASGLRAMAGAAPSIIGSVAGEMIAPEVEKAGEETGLIDLIAKGISKVVPTDILAAGPSPAEQTRQNLELTQKLKNVGVESGRLVGPMGIDVGGEEEEEEEDEEI